MVRTLIITLNHIILGSYNINTSHNMPITTDGILLVACTLEDQKENQYCNCIREIIGELNIWQFALKM